MGFGSSRLPRAASLGALVAILALGPLSLAHAQQIFIEPPVITPDADGVIQFSVAVDTIPAPGLTAFALTLDFSGSPVTLVDGAATVPKNSGVITCSAALANGPATAADLGSDLLISSGLGGTMLAEPSTSSLFSLVNGSTGGSSAAYVYGLGGAITPQTGPGALIEYLCFAGSAVPVGTSITVTPGLYPAESAALFLAGQGIGVADSFVAGVISIVNTPPIANNDSTSTLEDFAVSIDVLGNDTDADFDTLTITNLTQPGSGATQVSGGEVLYTPNFNFAGIDTFTYTPNDGTEDSAQAATVTVTVVAVNDTPELATLNDVEVVAESGTLTVDLSASDVDGDTLSFSAQNLPDFATLTDNGDGTGKIDFAPGFQDANSYDITVLVTDDGAPNRSDQQTFTLTVENTNRAPELAAIPPPPPLAEGASSTIPLAASDPDGDGLSFSTPDSPSFVTLSDNGDGTGVLGLEPGFDDAGEHQIKVVVGDDGVPVESAQQTVTITVTNTNRAPELVAIEDPQEVAEGGSLSIPLSASDPDGDTLSYSTQNLPSFAILSDAGDGTGALDLDPGFDDAGDYPITVIVTDDGSPNEGDQQTFTVTVVSTNQEPELAAIADPQEVAEGGSLSIPLSASDPDGDSLSYSTENLPTFATLTDNEDGTGALDLAPAPGDAADYAITVIVSDGGEPSESDQQTFTVTVVGTNRAPVLASIPRPPEVAEGASLTVTMMATDPDGDPLSYSTENLPTFGILIDAGDGTGEIDLDPGFDDAGEYPIAIIVSDDGSPNQSDQQVVTVTVTNTNRAPQLAAIPPAEIGEAAGPVEISVSASDDDGDPLTLSASNIPAFGSFQDDGGGAGTLTFEPGFEDAGEYLITVEADDGEVTDSEDLALTVLQVNRAPVLAEIGAQQTSEGVLLEFSASASDPDSEDSVALSASNLPTGADFIDAGAGAASFSWTPDFDQGGNFLVLVSATDNGVPVLADSEEVLLTVGDINRPPTFAAVGAQQVDVGETLSFNVQASDLDTEDTLTISASPLPAGANFVLNSGGDGNLEWTPTSGQEGNFEITFTVVDDGDPVLSDTLMVVVSVGDVNQPPEIDPIGNQIGTEGEQLVFLVTASDPDDNNLTFFITGLPAGADFTQDGMGAATFDWTPGFAESGVYPLLIEAMDDGVPQEMDFVEIEVTIGNVNRPPILAYIGPQDATVGDELQVPLSSTDLDGDGLVYSASSSDPELANADIVSNPDGSGQFLWTPGSEGLFAVTVVVTDDGTPEEADSEVVAIQVGAAAAGPDKPEGLLGRARRNRVYLRWSGSPTAMLFTVFRRLPSETEFSSVGSTGTYGFVDVVPSTGIPVEYFVEASNGQGTADSPVIVVNVR